MISPLIDVLIFSLPDPQRTHVMWGMSKVCIVTMRLSFSTRFSPISLSWSDRFPLTSVFKWLWLFQDFAMSGIRVGTLYTENRDLVEAMAQLGAFHTISGITQHQVAQMLRDRGMDQPSAMEQTSHVSQVYRRTRKHTFYNCHSKM